MGCSRHSDMAAAGAIGELLIFFKKKKIWVVLVIRRPRRSLGAKKKIYGQAKKNFSIHIYISPKVCPGQKSAVRLQRRPISIFLKKRKLNFYLSHLIKRTTHIYCFQKIKKKGCCRPRADIQPWAALSDCPSAKSDRGVARHGRPHGQISAFFFARPNRPSPTTTS